MAKIKYPKRQPIIRNSSSKNPFRSGLTTSHKVLTCENDFNTFFSKLTHRNLDRLFDLLQIIKNGD